MVTHIGEGDHGLGHGGIDADLKETERVEGRTTLRGGGGQREVLLNDVHSTAGRRRLAEVVSWPSEGKREGVVKEVEGEVI